MEVIVLAGGKGTRLQGVVSDVPKCLAPVAGQPFLQYLLDYLVAEGATHVVFSVGWLREQVKAFVHGREWPFYYDFAEEVTPLGTGGGIALALSYCKDNQVFVINGDTFYPVPLQQMPSLAPITLALKPMRHFSRYGRVEMEGALVKSFHEKEPTEEGLISGGVYLLQRSALSAMPQGPFSFEANYLTPQAAAGRVGGWVQNSYFLDIGIPEDYARAQKEIPAWTALQAASAQLMASGATTLFLDRDGVINEHLEGDYVRSWEQFVFRPDILEALKGWAAHFQHIVLVTNQRGVGKGLMTDADLSRIHAAMMASILEAGGRIDLILTCTAVSDEDPRRKPLPGMFYEACQLFPDITPQSSIMLGDSPSDAAFAQNCGMAFVQV